MRLPKRFAGRSWPAKNEALALLDAAARTNGFRPLHDAPGILLEIPRSLRMRRPACRLPGAVTETERGTEIHWTGGEDMPRALKHLLGVEEAMPDGKMYYHGMDEASAVSGVVLEGRQAFRNVVRNLGGDEWVLAVAQGKLASEAGIVALTEQRLLFVKGDGLGTARLGTARLDAPLDSGGGLVLGKKSSGETLRIRAGPATVIISQMGHGEGHGITEKFRERMKERARTTPILPAQEKIVMGVRTGNGPLPPGQDRRLPSGFVKDRAAGVHRFQSSGRVVGAPSK
jgi:hypothetical protein